VDIQTRIAVDIGGSHVRVGLVDRGQIVELVERRIVDLLAEHADLLTAIEWVIRSIAGADSRWGGQLPAIGVGVAAIVDPDGGLRVALPTGIPAGGLLRDRLTRTFRTQVVVDNDVSLAALGELTYGGGRNERNFALIALGTNIGMGVVIDGALYRGERGAAGEVGTMPVELGELDAPLVHAARTRTGATDLAPTGWAWLEELYGGQALANAWLSAVDAGESGDSHRVLRQALTDDPVARALVARALGGWAQMIAAVGVILDPGAVLLGGGIAADLPPFVDELRARVAALMPGRAPRIRIAEFGVNAGLIGAAVAAERTGASPMTEGDIGVH
jgi:glucokinase